VNPETNDLFGAPVDLHSGRSATPTGSGLEPKVAAPAKRRRPCKPSRDRVSAVRGGGPASVENVSERLMRRREVQRMTGLSRSSLYRLIASKEFPPPIKLSEKCVAWLESEVSEWIASRICTREAQWDRAGRGRT